MCVTKCHLSPEDGQDLDPANWTMIALIIMQAAWVVILMIVAVVIFHNKGVWIALAFSVLLVAYCYAIFALARRRRRWAWWACVALPVISLAWSGPGVVYNLWRASQDDPIFADSPATLLVVAINAVVLVIVPILLLTRLFVIRNVLRD